ncbi:MAG: ABC transporter ATP-binding protein [Deltaproteobacteria bacterium]|jgi:putative ABC transport system ATP-binding protein|nr:ABC transporter ATP-binding protein [Deltaproteobacteria bacterium]
MTSDEAIVRTEKLSRIYRQGTVEVHALRAVDFACRRGEFVALAGPSGSGKSTLLNQLGTLDPPTSGRVTIAGREVTRLGRAAAARFRLAHIGFVFQAFNLLPVLTAYENAEYTLLLQGVSAAKRRAIVLPLLERVGLGAMQHRRPHELSGGQQQRVAVVRAIAPKPAFVLADEPTANLDSQSSASLLDLLEDLNRSDGLTLVLASHDAQVIARARRVVRLRDGSIVGDEEQSPT